MKKYGAFFAAIGVCITVFLACTNKEISLVTNVELDFSQEYQNEGFVNTLLPATFTITPEVFLEEFVYAFTYEVLEGEGVFLNREDEILPVGEPIILERNADDAINFLLALHYKASMPGQHRVKITASDNFEKAIPLVAVFTIKNQPILWEATTAVDTIALGKTVPITVRLENASTDQELSFERSYRFGEGSGSLTDENSDSITMGTKTAIVPGTYTINILANQVGKITLLLELEDSNGQQLVQVASFEVEEELLNTAAEILSFVVGENQGSITENEIEFTVPKGTNISGLTPVFTISPNAESTPLSGTILDFTIPQTIVVTAEDGTTKNYTLTIIEKDIPVTEVIASQQNVSMVVGTTENLSVSIQPDSATDTSVFWSSTDESIVTVIDGKITAKAVGKTTLRVSATTDDSIFDEVELNVTELIIPATAIMVTATASEVVEGDSIQLGVKYTPEDATTGVITWLSSDENKATITSEGLVKTLEAGAVRFTALLASDNAIRNVFDLEILPKVIPITALSLTPKQLEIDFGSVEKTAQLQIAVAPDTTTETYKVSFSDPSIATINGETITALKTGEVTLTIVSDTDPMIQDTASLRVFQNPTAIAINPQDIVLEVGAEEPLTVRYDPDNTTERDLIWQSDKPETAKVDANGLVKAITPGEAIITATSGNGLESTIKVSVKAPDIAVSSIMLNTYDLRIDFDNSIEGEKLIAKVLPDNATDPSLKWSSSDPEIASVDSKGNIDPKTTGKVEITVKSIANPEITAKATVTMYISVYSVDLNPVTLFDDQTVQLTPIFSSPDPTNKNVTWSINDPTVATIDENGFLKALKAGNATIKLITEDGGKTASAPLTVKRAIVLIPDPVFEKRLGEQGFDTDPTVGQIYKTDALSITKLNINRSELTPTPRPAIIDFTGIESFVNLVELSCSNTSGNILNLNTNIKLEKLAILFSRSPIKFEKLTSLKELDVDYSGLSNNLNTLKKLELLSFDNGRLGSGDFSGLMNLKYVRLSNLTLDDGVLQVSNNANLEGLSIENMKGLTSKNLDISQNSKLLKLAIKAQNFEGVSKFECIQVRNVAEAINNSDWSIPEETSYALDCPR